MASLPWSIKAFEFAIECFLRDLEAMGEEQLFGSGSTARKPIDFAFEVGLVNSHIARRIKTEPSSLPAEGWVTAPPEFRTKAAVIGHIKSSAEDLLAATRSMAETGGDKLVPTSEGDTPVFDLVYFAAMHTMYHDGQLNYIQAASGDLVSHWQ